MEQLLDIIIISLPFFLMAITIAYYLRAITNQIKKENEILSELNPNNRP